MLTVYEVIHVVFRYRILLTNFGGADISRWVATVPQVRNGARAPLLCLNLALARGDLSLETLDNFTTSGTHFIELLCLVMVLTDFHR